MKTKTMSVVIVGLALLLLPKAHALPAAKAMYKVLVVMSYAPDYEFVLEEQQGIESVLADTCRIETV